MEERVPPVLEMVRDTVPDENFKDKSDGHPADYGVSRSLTALRCSHDVTQAELAERTGCTQSKISRIENSPNDRLKLEDLAMYARAFNMRVSIGFERELPAADVIGSLARQIRNSLDDVAEKAQNEGAAEGGAERSYEEFLFNMLDLFMDKLEAHRARSNGSAESPVATRAKNGKPEDSEYTRQSTQAKRMAGPNPNPRSDEAVVQVGPARLASLLSERRHGMTARIVLRLLMISTCWSCGSDSVTAPDLERGLREVGNMTQPRSKHVAMLLQNGKVLIAGGNAEMPPAEHGVLFMPNGLVSAEVFDPETGVSTPTGDMTASRWDDHGILLPDGRALIVSGILNIPIEKYDPHSGRFDSAANAPWSSGTNTATLLPNGEVLLIGGGSAGRARVFDPASGTFSDSFAIDHPGYGHTATLLKDGRVLIVGGARLGIELTGRNLIYDPSSKAFSRAGNLQFDRAHHKAVLLQDGRVLIVGGQVGDGPHVPTTEIYDPETNTFSAAGTSAMNPMAAHLLPSGRVFFIHFDNGNISLYNPDTQVFSPPTGHSIGPWRYGATVTPLNDGRVVIAGGMKTANDSHSHESISDQIFIFTP